MTALRRLAVALAALAILVLVALAVALPRIAGSDAVRARLTEVVEEATKRSFTFRTLDAGLLPPRLEIEAPVLWRRPPAPVPPEAEAAEPGQEAAASARSVELRLALLPLLARSVVVRSLTVEGGSAQLVRDEAGLRLAGRDLAEAPEAEPPAEPRSESPERDDGFAFAVRRVVIREGALRVVDQTREPSVKVALRDVHGEATGTARDAPIEGELRAALEAGGAFVLRASAARGGPFEARLELADVALEPFAPYAGSRGVFRGRASGTLDLAGEGSRPQRANADLRVAADALEVAGLGLRGPLALRGEIGGEDPRAPAGPIQIEATEAEVHLGRALRKPAGVPASLHGTLRRERGDAPSLRLEGAELVLASLRAQGALELAPRVRASLDAAPFSADALEELVPALQGRGLSGRLALQGVAVEAAPTAVRGRLVLEALGVGGTQEGHFELHGAIEGTGDALAGRDLRARLGGQEAPVSFRVADLAARPRFEAATRLRGADSSALVAALGGDRERLSGPLDLDARLAGPLGGDEPPLPALTGDVTLRIAPGRLRKVSLLRSAFEAAGGAADPDAARLDRYGGDAFESLSGSFRIAGGAARTDDLRLVYGGYQAELRGSVGLADRALDLRGTLVVDPEADVALGAAAGRGRRIPLASVTGTIDEPQVSLTREALAGVAAAYAGDERRREKWRRKLDERLGEGRGKGVLEAVDKLLESMEKPEAGGAEPRP